MMLQSTPLKLDYISQIQNAILRMEESDYYDRSGRNEDSEYPGLATVLMTRALFVTCTPEATWSK
jgi:hypothetical protein